jgi:formate hydrogenlyase transcriptional activator
MSAAIGDRTVRGPGTPTTVARYEALIRVSAALRACRDRETLFRVLARELRHVARFNFLGLALFDERTRAVEPLVLEATGERVAPPELSAEEQLTYWVLDHQQPLIIPVVDGERRFGPEMAYLRGQGIVSTCSLPLTTPRRRVGMLIAGSRQPHDYDAREVAFLTLVANQVALAIDDALTYGALQAALTAERERRQTLDASDQLLRALSTVLDVREVFPRISAIAAPALPHDRLTLSFCDAGGWVSLQAASDEWRGLPACVRLVEPPADEAAFGIVPDLTRATLPRVEPARFWTDVCAAGYRSLMGVRVTAREQRLLLHFWSKTPGAFGAPQAAVARRIADHVALAVSHEQLAEMERQALEATVRADHLEARVRSLADEVAAASGRMVGSSPEWQAVLKVAAQVAATDTTVLLTGESGTGKEVVARFIHHASNRARGPFVALNCAALPEQLLESELFGYERGAFTGAQIAKPGQIELAAGGVLFLDEVAEMSVAAQARFLRVLQEREFQRLGSTRTRRADVRVIAATNRDLRKAMARGDFREDLFYRLRVFDIRLPALRDRPADILPLADAFLQEIGQRFGRPPAGLTRDAKEALQRHHWPGNVRQLRNALERAAILCEGGLITTAHLALDRDPPPPDPPPDVPPARAPDPDRLADIERELIVRALTECAGNKSRAAARLGLSRTQLYVRLRRHGLS